jgi:hypothetical protein
VSRMLVVVICASIFALDCFSSPSKLLLGFGLNLRSESVLASRE